MTTTAVNAKDRKTTDHGSGRIRGTATVRLWGPAVRMFHCGPVAAFATARLTADKVQPVHEGAGCKVAGLVAFRLIRGFAGGCCSRLAQSVKAPGGMLSCICPMLRGGGCRCPGHNPAEAAMTVAVLLTLPGTGFTGWLMAEPDRVAMLPALPQIVPPHGRMTAVMNKAKGARPEGRSRRCTKPRPG